MIQAWATIYLLFNVAIPIWCYIMDKRVFKSTNLMFSFIPVFGFVYTIYLISKFKP